MNPEWPFAQGPRVATVTTRQVLEGGFPILRAVHYSDEEDWAFTCGTTSDISDFRLIAMEEVVDQPVLEDERECRERKTEAQLDQRRDSQRLADRLVAGVALGDRARQQLLDRPVDDRCDQEDRRPKQADLAVFGS